MTYSEFTESINKQSPPDVSNLLKALWYDAKGDWEKAHDVISEQETKSHCMIHAYLHRKEGDIWNADYWYTRAGIKRKEWTLQEEWDDLVHQFLSL